MNKNPPKQNKKQTKKPPKDKHATQLKTNTPSFLHKHKKIKCWAHFYICKCQNTSNYG